MISGNNFDAVGMFNDDERLLRNLNYYCEYLRNKIIAKTGKEPFSYKKWRRHYWHVDHYQILSAYKFYLEEIGSNLDVKYMDLEDFEIFSDI